MTAFRKLALFGILVVVAGCKHEPSLVGDWTATAQGATVSFNFAADKSITLVQTIPNVGPVKIKGTYEETADSLTVKFTGSEFKPTGTAIVDDAITKGLETLKAKPASYKLAWTKDKDGKEITLTPTAAPPGMNSTFTLTRK